MATQEELMARTEGRLARIADARARIEAKLQDNPNHPKAEAYKARLAEYEKSMELINFTLKTGRYVLLNG